MEKRGPWHVVDSMYILQSCPQGYKVINTSKNPQLNDCNLQQFNPCLVLRFMSSISGLVTAHELSLTTNHISARRCHLEGSFSAAPVPPPASSSMRSRSSSSRIFPGVFLFRLPAEMPQFLKRRSWGNRRFITSQDEESIESIGPRVFQGPQRYPISRRWYLSECLVPLAPGVSEWSLHRGVEAQANSVILRAAFFASALMNLASPSKLSLRARCWYSATPLWRFRSCPRKCVIRAHLYPRH